MQIQFEQHAKQLYAGFFKDIPDAMTGRHGAGLKVYHTMKDVEDNFEILSFDLFPGEAVIGAHTYHGIAYILTSDEPAGEKVYHEGGETLMVETSRGLFTDMGHNVFLEDSILAIEEYQVPMEPIEKATARFSKVYFVSTSG